MVAAAPDGAAGHTILGLTQMMLGKHAEGVSALALADRISKSLFEKARLGWALGQAGRVAEARKILAELESMAARDGAAPSHVAAVYAGLHDMDNAFLWMEKAISLREPALVQIKITPIFNPMRNDPRFAAILSRMGL
jgi:serine/threonine-protein kinase